MGYAKTILCLANSRKMSGRCLAGREQLSEGFRSWIRPVSARPLEEISKEERRYKDGTTAQVLDVLTVRFLHHRPKAYQTENHLIDPGFYWEKNGVGTWEDVEAAIDQTDGPLWINGHSSYSGRNDRVPEDVAAKLTKSLCLIQPDKLSIIVAEEGGDFGNPRRRVRGAFSFAGHSYRHAITDPVIESEYLVRENGSYDVFPVILCISLGELYEGYAYKLIATVITENRAS